MTKQLQPQTEQVRESAEADVQPYIIVVGGKVAQASLLRSQPGSAVALNPQPLPPRVRAVASLLRSR